MPRRLALPCLALLACFQGDALRGEPCVRDSDCGTSLRCTDDGLCGEYHCGTETITVPTFAPDIVLLVDHAIESQMNKDRGHWDLTRGVVARLGDALGGEDYLGLQLVPSLQAGNPDPCRVRSETQLLPAPNNRDELVAALPATAAILGEHALRGGLGLTLEAFAAVDPDGLRPQAIVLISDGPFNCAEVRSELLDRVFKFDAELIPSVAAAAAAGTPVFVVGVDVRATGGLAPVAEATIDQVDPHLAFNALADAGGRARPGPIHYYRHEDIDALIDDLRALPPAFADCRVPLPAGPSYAGHVVITIGDDALQEEKTCDSGHGWRFTEPVDADVFGKLVEIELCESTCADFRAARAFTIELRCEKL